MNESIDSLENDDDDAAGDQFDQDLNSSKSTDSNLNRSSTLTSFKKINDSSICSGSEAILNDKSLTFYTFSFGKNDDTNSCEEVLLRLQNEAQLALASVKHNVRQKFEAERKAHKKPSPIADIVGLPTYGLKRLKRDRLLEMNIGQLQVIVNDLCNQIESKPLFASIIYKSIQIIHVTFLLYKEINEELKKILIERDDLYMQQDAILVDVEDITK